MEIKTYNWGVGSFQWKFSITILSLMLRETLRYVRPLLRNSLGQVFITGLKNAEKSFYKLKQDYK